MTGHGRRALGTSLSEVLQRHAASETLRAVLESNRGSVEHLLAVDMTGARAGAARASRHGPATVCPMGPHRGPQGPNEDLSQCPTCWSPSWSMRPPGETIGLHADDCSLPERHESYCAGGGPGHPPAINVRGFWPGMDNDIAAALARHPRPEEH